MKVVKSTSLNKQKNKIRGLISATKSSAFQKGLNLSPSYIYCRGIKEVYLDSRTKLSPHEFQPFLDWVEEQSSLVFAETSKQRSDHAELAGVISSNVSRSDLETELTWISHLIAHQSNKIKYLIDASLKIERLLVSDKVHEAIDVLEECDLIFGLSFFSHDLRVALEHLSGGLERQKEYVSKIRSKVKGGLLGFVSYYTSIRNEDKTTFSKFYEDLNYRLSKHKYYDEPVKRYLKYRLAGEVVCSKEHINDILFIEQSHHIFDIYETYIKILQLIAKSEPLIELRPLALQCCNTLGSLKDVRLKKISSRLSGSEPNTEKRNAEYLDTLLKIGPKGVLKDWKSRALEDKVEPWSNIYLGFFVSELKNKKFKSEKIRLSKAYTYITNLLLSDSSSIKHSKEKIKKLSINYPNIPLAQGLLEFSEQFLDRLPNDKHNFNNVGLHSKNYGVEDITNPEFFNNNFNVYNSSSALWAVFNGFQYQHSFNNLPSNVINTFQAYNLFNNEKYDDLIELVSITGKSNYKNFWPINLELLLSAHFKNGNINHIAKTITTEGVKSKNPYPLYYIENYLNNSDWLEYKNISDPIIACVAIHLLWKRNESAETASMLRFAIRQCLRLKKVKLPSDLMKLKRETSLRVWKYFFREVCKNDFIDQLLHGSNELLLERQRICAYMSGVDYESTDKYENEMADIASTLAIDNGKKIIDRTRIHVDIEALKRWAQKELIEDYRRYHDLLDVNIKSSFDDEFNDIFSDLLKKGGASKKWKSLNKNSEADMVFISMLARLSDEFLNSPEYGLDFYLSKRVRHQSFIGLIRGPLEFDDLITTKENTGEYHTNVPLLSKLSSLSSEDINKIDIEFKKFSKKFDDLLESAKNSYFQIQGPDNPKGLIKLEVPEQAIFLLEMMTHKVDDFLDFVDIAVPVFWTSLSIPLNNVRNYISQNLKQSIVSLFDELTLSLKKSVDSHDEGFTRLTLNIKSCSIKVQRELDQAALWFTRNNKSDIAQSTFDAEQLVDIAIDSTLKCHQSFHPKISKKVINQDGLALDTSTLIFVHDVMFVALGNIYRHSGVKEPNVSITTEITESTYSIQVTSDFSPGDLDTTIDKLNEIKALIREKKFERRTRKEGGSGFLKIAAVALQDPLGGIDFSATEDSFTLNVTYRILMAEISMENSYAE